MQDVLPYFRRLRYLAELVVAHDDAVVVVVADIIEKAYTVLRRKILFGGIEDAGLGIGSPVRCGDLCHIRLQSDNHRLVGEREAFYLMGCNAHDERFSCSYLMIGDAASVLLEHPDAVLLTGINGRDAILTAERLEIEVGEGLVRAVVLRPYKTVELAVVEVGEPVLELLRLRFEPVGKTVSYLVDLGVGQLYLLGITHLDVVAVLVFADALHHVGHGVVQGMLQERHAVVAAVIALDAEFFVDFHVRTGVAYRELIERGRVGNFDLRLIQVGHIGGKHARGYPPLPEIKVEVIKGYLFGDGLFQCGKGFVHAAIRFRVHLLPLSDVLHLGDDITRYKTILDFIAVYERIEEDTPFECSEQFLLAAARQLLHIAEFYTAVAIE